MLDKTNKIKVINKNQTSIIKAECKTKNIKNTRKEAKNEPN